ncbi:MAG: amidophosphoribosyltransferase [Pseudomonadota bacterium]
MCGIAGMLSSEPVNQSLYDALTVLQHRGQDAAGIVTCEGVRLHQRKANGLVRDVFRQDHMQRLRGTMGIGHVRYPTAGSSSSAEAQPMYVNSPYGIVLAHNGNLTNSEALQADLYRDDLRHVNTGSDSEVLLNVFAHELARSRADALTAEQIFDAVARVHERCRGAYAAVALIVGGGVVGFRGPHGIRPLVGGQREGARGMDYMLASESAALDILGFQMLGDVAPGEAVVITPEGRLLRRQCACEPRLQPCLFEYVYFARPDSIMDAISVYRSRLRMGEYLADRILERFSARHGIDVVVPVPDTGRTSALPLSQRLGLPFREGFVKNRYIGRTFIMPGQTQRKKSVRQKLNLIEAEFKDKNVLLVDDSIVRGTTIRQIIDLARQAGAREVYLASAAPAVTHPNVYGIDMPVAEELIAHGRSEAEVAAAVGADWLIYQRLDDLIASVREGNTRIESFETSVFSGNYVTGDIDAAYLRKLSLQRNDKTKQRIEFESNSDPAILELHNHP